VLSLGSVCPQTLRPPTGLARAPDARTISAAFNLFDRDGSGTIDAVELKGVCREIGMHMTDADLQRCMAELDEDGSGDIDLKEFKAWFNMLAKPGSGGGSDEGSMLEEIKVPSPEHKHSLLKLCL
jgi:hypothetical protein